MQITKWEIAKEQVERFWALLEIKADAIGRLYPLRYESLKELIEHRLPLAVVEQDFLTTSLVEKILIEHELISENEITPFGSDASLAGALFTVGDTGVVFVPGSETAPTRRLFSLAHELGHYYIDSYVPYISAGRVSPKRIFNRDAIGTVTRDGSKLTQASFDEFKANQFAAELLMPRKFILKSIKRLMRAKRSSQLTKQDLRTHVAKKFGVSNRAADFRLRDLGVNAT